MPKHKLSAVVRNRLLDNADKLLEKYKDTLLNKTVGISARLAKEIGMKLEDKAEAALKEAAAKGSEVVVNVALTEYQEKLEAYKKQADSAEGIEQPPAPQKPVSTPASQS